MVVIQRGGLISNLIFASKRLNEIVLCDYCQYYKCRWLDAKMGKIPNECPEMVSFQIADERISRDEWDHRVELAKKVGVFTHQGKKWYFSVKMARNLISKDLKEVIEVINNWSEHNNFKLCNYVKYVEIKAIDDY